MCRPKAASTAPAPRRSPAQHPGQEPLAEAVDRVQREAEECQLHQEPAGRLGVGPRARRSGPTAEHEVHDGPEDHPGRRREDEMGPGSSQLTGELLSDQGEEPERGHD